MDVFPNAGVGGGVNPSPREEGKGMRPVQRAKPPQPRELVGFIILRYGVGVVATRFFVKNYIDWYGQVLGIID